MFEFAYSVDSNLNSSHFGLPQDVPPELPIGILPSPPLDGLDVVPAVVEDLPVGALAVQVDPRPDCPPALGGSARRVIGQVRLAERSFRMGSGLLVCHKLILYHSLAFFAWSYRSLIYMLRHGLCLYIA